MVWFAGKSIYMKLESFGKSAREISNPDTEATESMKFKFIMSQRPAYNLISPFNLV